MKTKLLFIQGGGNDGYTADAELVASLQSALGKDYVIHYPALIIDEKAADFGWPAQIGAQLDRAGATAVIIAHSLGASMLLKYLSENNINRQLRGLFLIAPPFWEGSEEWVQGLRLRKDFADHLPQDIPFFFYHCRDDKEIPFTHFIRYQQEVPQATFHALPAGGHQLDNGVSIIIRDIKALEKIR